MNHALIDITEKSKRCCGQETICLWHFTDLQKVFDIVNPDLPVRPAQ